MKAVQKRLPLGVNSFEDLREHQYIYVDKTDLIYELVNGDIFCLITRPRRFGKSLLISTLESLFLRGVKYFSGLKIEQLWKENTYPVLKLDMSGLNYSSIPKLRTSLCAMIKNSLHKSGLNAEGLPDDSPQECLINLQGQVDATHTRLVVLVDEYDYPIVSVKNTLKEREELVQELKEFFYGRKKYFRILPFHYVLRHYL